MNVSKISDALRMQKTVIGLAALACALGSVPAFAQQGQQWNSPGTCSLHSSIVTSIQNQLAAVVDLSDGNGGLFIPHPNQMWSAVVDRAGILCSVIKVGDAWPGSRDIAIAKASTANDFSNDLFALSTANLYAATQPGGSLYGLNNSNPFNPLFNQQGTGIGQAVGGIITFGGGVPLYENGQVIGGLGVSGDSSCADHAIAFRMRKLAGLDGTPAGPNGSGAGADNIIYPPSTLNIYGPPQTPGFWQPHCSANDLTPGQIATIP
jgi:uncharacterized protein GlcG (DUF336 family)